MFNPRYYYTDENGQVQKLVRCSNNCGNGPFKQDEKEKYVRVGNNSYLCMKCYRTLNPECCDGGSRELQSIYADGRTVRG